MKRILLLVLLVLLSAPVFSGVRPSSQSLGQIVLECKEGSMEALVYKALQEEYTLEWVEKYAVGGEAFAVSYSQILSSLLPQKSFLVSVFDGNQVKVRISETSTLVTFIIKEGKIAALRLN